MTMSGKALLHMRCSSFSPSVGFVCPGEDDEDDEGVGAENMEGALGVTSVVFVCPGADDEDDEGVGTENVESALGVTSFSQGGSEQFFKPRQPHLPSLPVLSTG
jgi:hypothetical protein